MAINKLKGTLDYFGLDAKKYDKIINKCKDVAGRFGFQEIITPIMESTELFVRGVGDGSDIVKKEMYTFNDKGNRSITLRPEGTAAITRSYVENKMYVNPGLAKYYYYGPMFRNERPQAGRFRQFTQFGVEVFGDQSPVLDADIINMCYMMLKEVGINNCQVHINTIGAKESRTKYIEALKNHFAPYLESMCNDCKDRYERNTLRILDCKVDKESEALKNAPSIQEYLSEEDRDYFNKVLETLDILEVPYVVDEHLVRGLDYYTGCVFELVLNDETSDLNGLAIAAGGRYNGLSSELGGPVTNAIGFAFGVDRLVLLDKEEESLELADVTVITLGEDVKKYGLTLANYLRQNGIKAEIDYKSHNLKPQFKLADRVKSPYIIIIGSDEVENNMLKLKDTVRKEEYTISTEELKKYFNLKGETKYAYKK